MASDLDHVTAVIAAWHAIAVWRWTNFAARVLPDVREILADSLIRDLSVEMDGLIIRGLQDEARFQAIGREHLAQTGWAAVDL